MTRRLTTMEVVLLIGVLICVDCTESDKSGYLQVSIIVGEADLIRKGEAAPLLARQSLRAGDTLRVGDEGKVKLELADGAAWYVNRKTVLALQEPVALSEAVRRLPVTILSGEVHVVKRKEGVEEYLFSSSSWKARITAADATVSADDGRAGVVLLSGFTTFTSADGKETVIPACSRLVVGDNGEGTLESLQTADIEAVKLWVGTTVIDEAVARSDCSIESKTAENRPPEWQRLPRENVMPGERYCDTVEAVDPEQGPLTYTLSKAPAGMNMDTGKGIIMYPSPVAGRHEIVIVATDNASQSCTAFVALNVSAGLTLRISAPRMAEPAERFTIAAIVKGVDRKKVRYRFDCNGDGTFEIPADGAFGKKSYVNRYGISAEGVYMIRAEARTDDGQTAAAKRRIVINASPVAKLKAVPEEAATGMPVELDMTECADSRNGTTPLRKRIDVDGNGSWDLPGGNEYSTEKKMVYTWETPGTYKVIAEVTDMDGASSTAVVQITVSKGVQGGSISCPDTVHVGDTVNISCTPKGGTFKITKFAWSFNGDTIFEKTTLTPAVKTTFVKEGIRSVLCRMTDEKGGVAAITKVITVVNSASKVDAGGPYRGSVNKPVLLTGSASDQDSKIISYSWDFDGDGTVDWTSPDELKATFTYKKAGTYIAYFSVKTDDGSTSGDSAVVEVLNKPPVAGAGEDLLSRKNRKIKLSGTADDPDSNIVLYEWDFDGDGTADWSSKENSVVEHAFERYSEAVFSIRDADGAMASDTVKIIICPDDMQTIEDGKFCIDTYEFPNKRNSKPQVNVSYTEASQICRSLGKRLCTSSEWETACTDGKARNAYPYGKKYDVDKCNTLGNPRVKNSMANAGDFFECKTGSGIFDMSGNLAEWTDNGGKQPYAYGGSWQNGRQGSSCNSKVQLGKDKKYFYVGFRCCK
ncbi:MAG: PKD domain-containing protein [Chitinispirillaceae bacterium]|nr:PKD domain-containing protein [Chitinispirillaceae bacterium]